MRFPQQSSVGRPSSRRPRPDSTRCAIGPRRGWRSERRAVLPRHRPWSGLCRSPQRRDARRATEGLSTSSGPAAGRWAGGSRCRSGSCRNCAPCGARSRPPRAPAVSASRVQAGGGSTAAASTCSPRPPEPGTSGRRDGRPASPPRAPAPSAGRCCVCRGGRSVRRPARRTSPACRNVDHSGNAAPVTRSAPGARRPRCRRADVHTGCAPGTTVSRTPDTRPAPQQPWPALPPTRRQVRRFQSRHLRPGGTTGPGGGHHPRPFMIAISVTLRGPGTESDPEPKFSRRRRRAASVGAWATHVVPGRRSRGSGRRQERGTNRNVIGYEGLGRRCALMPQSGDMPEARDPLPDSPTAVRRSPRCCPMGPGLRPESHADRARAPGLRTRHPARGLRAPRPRRGP